MTRNGKDFAHRGDDRGTHAIRLHLLVASARVRTQVLCLLSHVTGMLLLYHTHKNPK